MGNSLLVCLLQSKRKPGHNENHHHSAPHGVAVALAGGGGVVAADAEEDVDSDSEEPEVNFVNFSCALFLPAATIGVECRAAPNHLIVSGEPLKVNPVHLAQPKGEGVLAGYGGCSNNGSQSGLLC